MGRQCIAQRLFFGVVEGGAHHGAADALHSFQHLVCCHLADHQEERGITGLQGLRDVLHEPVVDPDIDERAAESAAPANGIMKTKPIKRPQKAPPAAPRPVGWKSWLSLTLPLGCFTAMTASSSSIK